MNWKIRWPEFNFPPINLWNAPKTISIETPRKSAEPTIKITKADPTDIINSILKDR